MSRIKEDNLYLSYGSAEILAGYRYDEDEIQEDEIVFYHPLTGQESSRIENALSGFSEQNPEENKDWEMLEKSIKRDDDLDERIYNSNPNEGYDYKTKRSYKHESKIKRNKSLFEARTKRQLMSILESQNYKERTETITTTEYLRDKTEKELIDIIPKGSYIGVKMEI